MAEENVMAEKPVKKIVRQVVISALRSGEQPFLAWGYSYLKGMQLVPSEDDPEKMVEEEIEYKVPIKSVGVAEFTDRLSKKTPTPPTSKRFVKKGSDEGRALNLTHDQIVIEENFADPAYKEQLKAHAQRSVYGQCLAGLAVDVYDGERQVIKSNGHNKPTDIIDEEAAINVLKGQGLSNEQFDNLYQDIKDLTSRERERVDQE